MAKQTIQTDLVGKRVRITMKLKPDTLWQAHRTDRGNWKYLGYVGVVHAVYHTENVLVFLVHVAVEHEGIDQLIEIPAEHCTPVVV
jgi:hypothetical protein